MYEKHVRIMVKDGEHEYAVIPKDVAPIDLACTDDAVGLTVPGEILSAHLRCGTLERARDQTHPTAPKG